MPLPHVTAKSGHPPSIVDFYDPHINGKDAHGRTRAQIHGWDNDRLERCHDYIQILFPLPEGSMFSYDAPIIDKETLEAFRSNATLQMSLFNSFITMLEFYGFKGVMSVEQRDAKETLEEAQPKTKQIDKEKENNKAAENEQTEYRTRSDALASASDTETPHFNTKDLDKVDKLCDSHLCNEDVWSSMADFRVARGPNFKERSKNWCVRMDHNHLRITRILRCLRVLGLQLQCEAFYNALKDVYNDPNINIGERSMVHWRRAVREPLHIAPDGTECKWLLDWLETNQAKE